MAEQSDQGTGKHPHKSTEEPYPHREGQSGKPGGSGSGGSEQKGQSRSSSSESSDLKEREYTDSKGEVHHHTRTSEEQHGKK